MENNSMDQELVREFLSESQEALEGLDSLFIILEETPDDLSTIDRIFRPIHSIKGNSSFFGLVNIKNFSHAMENILQEVRSRKRVITPEVINVLLRGTDLLRGMLHRFAQSGSGSGFSEEEEACLKEFSELLSAGGGDVKVMARHAREALRDLDEMEIPEQFKEKFAKACSLVTEVLNHIAPAAESDNGGGYSVGGEDVTEQIETVQDFVGAVQEKCADDEVREAFLAALTSLRQVAQEHSISPLVEHLDALQNDFVTIHFAGIGFDDLMCSLLNERLEGAMNSVMVKESRHAKGEEEGAEAAAKEKSPEQAAQPASAPAQEQPAAASAEKAPKSGAPAAGKTLRIEEEKVDSFMSFVGELIIASEVFAYLQKKFEAFPEVRQISQEFKNANISFNELSTNLQKSLMAVRRMPLRNILQKIPRIVRDLAQATDKKVNLVIEGDDIQIDKSLLEGLENPLVHMVRNSVDHGLEDPEGRKSMQKDETGSILISASADEETFKLKIIDDGRGLDLEAIKNKAINKGMLSEEKAAVMDDKEAALLIFGAGVSTAQKVTDISGRGVGMDVVRTNIEKLGGSISIDTQLGKGTTFTITLPMTVTLMVVDGLVARVGNGAYIVPVSDVRESVRPVAGQVSSITGRGEVIDVRGELYRLLRLHEILGVKWEIDDPVESTVVLVEYRGTTCGILVDEVLGQQSVVVKNLGSNFDGLEFLKGGAVMGDGRIGLVLDIEGLLRISRIR